MAQTTTNYGLYKPEATDTYNHLVYDNPNMDTIDAAMKANADHAVDNATCIKSGTVHAVTRSNTSCPIFKFTATGDWNTGDTMNVDGTPVSVFLPNGTAPLTGCFVINTEVLAAISGTRVTLYCPVFPDASDVAFDNTGTTLSASNVEGAIQELNDSDNIVYDANNSVKDMLDKMSLVSQSASIMTVSDTYQLNASMMACKLIIMCVGRYGRLDSKILPVSRITDGACTDALTFLSNTTNAWLFKIDTQGLVTFDSKTGGPADPFVMFFGVL